MSVERAHLEDLINGAISRGASKAVSLKATSVVVDPRVRMKCQVPICKNYGQSLMCPPAVMSPKEFSEVLARYSDAVLVQWSFAPNKDVLGIIEKGSISDLDSNEVYTRAMKDAVKRMTTQLNSLEGDAMKMGYRFATAFSGGPCSLCDECVGIGGRCRHPFMARPSMEAVGIDVIATAARSGVPIKYPAESTATLTGLLLVD